MADYRLYITKRRTQIDQEIAELEAEKEQLTIASRVLDDAEDDENSERVDSGMGTTANAILDYLKANSSMATTEIRNRLSSDHGINSQNAYSTIHRLKNRGLIEKTGRMSWRLKKKKKKKPSSSEKPTSTPISGPSPVEPGWTESGHAVVESPSLPTDIGKLGLLTTPGSSVS